jgi:hypothetical protein
MMLTISRARSEKGFLALAVGNHSPAAAAGADTIEIGDPVKDRRRKVANFARYLGIDPHRDGDLMWIAGW